MNGRGRVITNRVKYDADVRMNLTISSSQSPIMTDMYEMLPCVEHSHDSMIPLFISALVWTTDKNYNFK